MKATDQIKLKDVKDKYQVVDLYGTADWKMVEVNDLKTGDTIRLYDKNITTVYRVI